MPVLPNEFQETYEFFETLLKENYGEHKFKKALSIIENFNGDRYLEHNEKKLTKMLVDEIFRNNEDQAQMFLHECSSFLLMKGSASDIKGDQRLLA